VYRENSHKALLAHRETLEKMVEERTRELSNEVKIRKAKELELRKSETRYRTLYDSSGDGIGIIQSDGRFSSANLRFCSQVGFSEEELRTMRPEDIYADRDAGNILHSVFIAGHAEFETTMINRNGDHLPVEIRAKRIFFDKEIAVLYSSRDIAERKQREAENKKLQEKLHRASKMEAIGLMAGGIAHDLNNILAGVTGYPELMLLKLPQDSELRKPLTQILQSGKRAAAVVTELLTMARGVASTKDPHDCNLLIENFLNTLEARKIIEDYSQVSVITELSKNTGRIPCSPIHFQKCIMNLLLNAVEVVEDKPGGIVEITSYRHQPDDELLKRLHLKKREYVVVSVKDNGPGIAKEDIEHIFEPFYSRKILDRSGTGLGLTVVWNVVTEHDGAVHVDSSSEGTTFNLYFPATDDVKIEKDAEMITWNPSSKNILVVDDEPQLRDIAGEMLSNCGYSVATVSSGEQAIARLKTSEFDLVLLDMMMAPGINGRQTYEEIIKFRPNQKAIIASGFSEDEEIKKVISLGVSGFIQKPYEFDQLRLAVQKSIAPDTVH
jgi:PAS domain S-box-containing protein